MWPNPEETADLVTFTEEILNRKLYFLCSVQYWCPFIKKTTLYPEDLANALTVANIDELGIAGIAKGLLLKKSLHNHEVEYFKQNFHCNLKFILKTIESEAYFGRQTSVMKLFCENS